jgi:hypothetical protein
MSDSPFTIVPKDKRVLKSSKVRSYFKYVNALLEPNKQRILDDANKATTDAMIYGFGSITITEGDMRYPEEFVTTEIKPD